MQQDLEAYLETYNRKRPYRGRGMEGRTPCQVFKADLEKAKQAAEAKPENPSNLRSDPLTHHGT